MCVDYNIGIFGQVKNQILKTLNCGRCTVQAGTLGHTHLHVDGTLIGLGHKLGTYIRQQEHCSGNQYNRCADNPPAFPDKTFQE